MSISLDNYYSINKNEISAVCGENTKDIVVYGFGGCHYDDLEDALLALKIFRRVENGLSLGDRRGEGFGGFERVSYIVAKKDNLKNVRRICKSGLVNVVWENYKRMAFNQPIMPVLFCIDSSAKSMPWILNSENLTTRENTFFDAKGVVRKLNESVTHSELRRAYKLCSDLKLSENIKISAAQTFKFVKLNFEGEDLCLLPLEAPWEAPDFQGYWKSRMDKSLQVVKPNDWREQIAEKERLFALEMNKMRNLTSLEMLLQFSEWSQHMLVALTPDKLCLTSESVQLFYIREKGEQYFRFASKEAQKISIEENPMLLAYASKEIEQDLIAKNPTLFPYASKGAQREYVLNRVQEDGSALKDFPDFNNDREIVLAAIQNDSGSFRFVSDCLKADLEIVWMVLKEDEMLYRCIHPTLQDREDIGFFVIEKDGTMFKYCGPTLKENLALVKIAIQEDPDMLAYASERVQKIIVQENLYMLKYASKEMQDSSLNRS